MTADHETMTAEENDADMSASRERNIEAARSHNFEAYLAVKARSEAQAATIADLQAALAVARGALTKIKNGREVRRDDHTEIVDRDDAAEIAEAAIVKLDAALKGAHPARGGANVG